MLKRIAAQQATMSASQRAALDRARMLVAGSQGGGNRGFTGTPKSLNGWVNNWTLATGSTPPTHPHAAENDQKLRALLLATPRVMQLVPVREVIHTLLCPRLQRPMDLRNVTHQHGKLLTTNTDLAWMASRAAGRHFGVSTNDAKVGEVAERPHGTAVLDLPREFDYGPFRDLLNDFVDDQILNPSIGATFPSYTNEEEVKRQIKQERCEGGEFDPRAHYGREGKVIVGYNPYKYLGEWRNYFMTLADLLHYVSAELGQYIIAYCKALAEFYGCPYDSIAQWTIIIVRYKEGCGFIFHIDGIADFGNYPGPVSNLHIPRHAHPKHFDIIDFLCEKPSAKRYTIQPGQTHVMTGKSRALYAHGVPRETRPGRQHEMTTLGVKCPELCLQYKHAWVKEMTISILSVPFDKPVQYIDIEEWFRANRANKQQRRKPPARKARLSQADGASAAADA